MTSSFFKASSANPTAADKPAPVHYDDRDFFDADNDIYLRQAA